MISILLWEKDLILVSYTHIVNDVCISFISKVTKLGISRLKMNLF